MREEFVNTEFSTCKYMMDTNCMSHIALIKGLLPRMIERKQGGQIVNILTVSALMGVAVRTMYCASKAAMDGFTKALRIEAGMHNIKVTAIYPYYVQTNISKNAASGSGEAFGKVDSNINKGMPVDKAANMILKAIYLERDEIVVGKFHIWLAPRLCFLSSTIDNIVGTLKAKSQHKVMAAAKKE